MKIVADTNVLIRLVMADDELQSVAAAAAMERADLVAISMITLCEFVWVLRARYALPRDRIAAAIRMLVEANGVSVNRPAVEAGLAILEAGGDFADGAIAFEGRWLGGETFVSFDRDAVKRLQDQGLPAQLLE